MGITKIYTCDICTMVTNQDPFSENRSANWANITYRKKGNYIGEMSTKLICHKCLGKITSILDGRK